MQLHILIANEITSYTNVSFSVGVARRRHRTFLPDLTKSRCFRETLQIRQISGRCLEASPSALVDTIRLQAEAYKGSRDSHIHPARTPVQKRFVV
ncbi:MAG: hypothetical protein V7K79_20750 [Nostoc sp.]